MSVTTSTTTTRAFLKQKFDIVHETNKIQPTTMEKEDDDGGDYDVEQTNKKMIKTESANVTKEEMLRSSRQQSLTNMTKTRIICGTSGYSYSHWKGKYYPKGVGGSSTKQWQYYSTKFGAVELNGTHYKWHKKETWENWKENACQASGGNCSCHKNDFTIAGDDDDGMQ